jgi:hypothetical protein
MLLVLAGALAARAGPPGESVSAPLKSVPLDSGNSVVSKTDVAAAQPRILDDFLIPSLEVQFSPVVKEYGLTIAGQKVAIVSTDDGFIVKGDSGQTALHKNGVGLATIALPIPSAQKYFLAFPYGYSSAERGLLMVRGGGTVQCQIDGQTVMFYDDNLDGRYALADDSFRVGCADAPIDVFAPLSEFFSTGRSIYQIDSLAEDGTALQYSSYRGATGKLSIAGPSSSDWAMVVALANSNGQMNLVSEAGGSSADSLAVIPGQYKLLYGGVFAKKTGTLIALVAPGSLPAVEVAADQTQTVQLGGSLHLEFTVNTPAADQIGIQPASIHVKGKAGEEYTAVNFDRSKPPEVFISRGGAKVSLGKMTFT